MLLAIGFVELVVIGVIVAFLFVFFFSRGRR
jgi:hypothetical protein